MIRLYEPGMAAAMMDLIGHDYRCAVPSYAAGRAMPDWPARRPLVVGIPSAIMHVELERTAERQFLDLNAQAFCGGLKLGEVMEHQ